MRRLFQRAIRVFSGNGNFRRLFKAFFPALSVSENDCRPIHVDKDASLSLLHVWMTEVGLPDHVQKEIVQYFCLPTFGYKIALRPGDMVIFNPKFPHGASSRTACYNDRAVVLGSYYLKDDHVSGRDNSMVPNAFTMALYNRIRNCLKLN